MPTFLAAGSIAYDLLLTYDGSFAEGIDPDHLDELSVGYVTRHMVRHFGGTGANVAWNLRLIRQEVFLAGAIGTDAALYIERLKKQGVNVSLVREHNDLPTPTAIVGTDSAECQITFFNPGADTHPTAADVSLLKDALSFVMVSPHNTTSMLRTASACQEHGIPYFFDPGQQSLEFPQDELRRIVKGSAGLIVNAYEWALLSEALQWSADELLSFMDLLVVTHGEHGLALQTKEESIVLDAVPARKLVNPTGAGDALRAGLLTGLALGWDVKNAGRLGAALASFVVEEEGTQIEELVLDDLYERARNAYGEELPRLES